LIPALVVLVAIGVTVARKGTLKTGTLRNNESSGLDRSRRSGRPEIVWANLSQAYYLDENGPTEYR
jgi:hypothetical protein